MTRSCDTNNYSYLGVTLIYAESFLSPVERVPLSLLSHYVSCKESAGPVAGRLMEFKAQTILKQLKDVTEWHQLGIQLNVALSELRNIEQNYPRDAERCKSEMVNIWLKQDNDASWWKLAQALYTVGCHVLSKELSQLDQRGE